MGVGCYMSGQAWFLCLGEARPWKREDGLTASMMNSIPNASLDIVDIDSISVKCIRLFCPAFRHPIRTSGQQAGTRPAGQTGRADGETDGGIWWDIMG